MRNKLLKLENEVNGWILTHYLIRGVFEFKKAVQPTPFVETR
jgi:hypothetical protein